MHNNACQRVARLSFVLRGTMVALPWEYQTSAERNELGAETNRGGSRLRERAKADICYLQDLRVANRYAGFA